MYFIENWQNIVFRMHIFNNQGFDRLGHLNPEKLQTEYLIVRTLHIWALTDVGNFSSAKLTWQLFS